MKEYRLEHLPPGRHDRYQPYWDGCPPGRLTYHGDPAFQKARRPPGEECPGSVSDDWAWNDASGRAKLISWVVYHIAQHKAFENRLPYNVAVVELVEGPRLISNVVGIEDHEGLVIDQPLQLRIENEGGVALPRFVPA